MLSLFTLASVNPLTATGESKFTLISSQKNHEKVYTNPGIASYRGDKWIGSEHLYNIPEQFQVVVDFVVPEDSELNLNPEEIKKKLTENLKNENILTSESALSAPLPILHCLVLAYPLKGGVAFSTHLRFMESIDLERVQEKTDIDFQAVTWEKMNLFVSTEEHFEEQLKTSIDTLVNQFRNKVFYLKNKEEEKSDVASSKD